MFSVGLFGLSTLTNLVLELIFVRNLSKFCAYSSSPRKVSRKAAEHKKIESGISGDVKLFVVSNIEAGNIVGQTLIFGAKSKIAGRAVLCLGCHLKDER